MSLPRRLTLSGPPPSHIRRHVFPCQVNELPLIVTFPGETRRAADALARAWVRPDFV